MAVQKTAKLVDKLSFDNDTSLLQFVAEEPLGFRGGQYLIVSSGLTGNNGQVVKRAYSILSSDKEQQRFTLAVRRIREFGEGAGSRYMTELEVGDELRFSGPWGKLAPEGTPDLGERWVIASDTGITAALGLLNSRSMDLPGKSRLLWLTSSPNYFLSRLSLSISQ